MDYSAITEAFDARFTNTSEISGGMGVEVIGMGLCLRQDSVYCPPRIREYFILMLTLDGLAWVQEGKRRKRLSKNDWTLLMPGQTHSYRSISSWSFLYVEFRGVFVERVVNNLACFKKDNLYFKQKNNDAEKIFFKLAMDRARANLMAEVFRDAIMLELMACLHKNHAVKGINENPIQEAQKYIMENLTSPITIEALAGKAKMSPSHFSRVFKAMTGYTPIGIVNKLRIERAQELIQQRPATVKIFEIAEMCGFNDQFYFSRVFRKFAKMSPEAFRASVTNDGRAK